MRVTMHLMYWPQYFEREFVGPWCDIMDFLVRFRSCCFQRAVATFCLKDARSKPKHDDYEQPFLEASRVERILAKLLLRRTFVPSSALLKIWYGLLFGIAVLHVLAVPLEMAFYYTGRTLWSFNLVVDLVSLSCIYFGFHVAYYNDDGILVTHPLITARHYAKTTLFIDFLGCFPFEYFYGNPISDSFNERDRHIMSFMRLSRLFQLSHVPPIFTHLESDIERSAGVVRLAKYSLYLIFFFNVRTCVLFLIACPPLDLVNHSLTEESIYMTDSDYWCLTESWLSRTVFGGRNVTATQLYTISMYFVTASSMSVG